MSVEVPGRRGSRSPLTPLKNVFDQSAPANRQLTFGLAALFVLLAVTVLPGFLTWSFGVDLEIPLRAAGRWASGGQPYLASSFSETTGPTLPFLYPPWLLPILTPISALPRTAVLAVWLALGLAVAIPAVLGYNALVRGNKGVLGKLNRFAYDLHALFVTGSRIGSSSAFNPGSKVLPIRKA